jgi:hypothetical protein
MRFPLAARMEGIAEALYIERTTGPNFAFRDNGLPFVNQIELGKTKGIGLAG